MNIRRSAAIAGIFCLLGLAAGAKDKPKSEPVEKSGTVIKSETRLVLVDTIVTDKKGNYLRDLKQEDFRVWEDNKEQEVKTFSFEADSAAAAGRPPRYLVLMFDNSSLDPSDQITARQAAAKFVETNAGPNRMIAVVNFGGSLQVTQNFTSNPERLKAAVMGVRFSAVSSDDSAMAERSQLTHAAADFGARSMLLAVKNLAKGLTAVPGRKLLVLLTAGFPLTPERTSEALAVVDACNRANVAIYPIDVRGLVAGTPGPATMGGPQSRLRTPYGEGYLQLASFNPGSLGVAMFQSAPSRGGGGSVGGTTGGSTGGTTGGTTGGSTGGTTSGGLGGRGSGTGTGTAPGGSTGGTRGGGYSPTPGTGRSPGYSPGSVARAPGYGSGMSANTLSNFPNRNTQVLLPSLSSGATGNQQIMMMLAEGTGGFVIRNTNDLLAGMEKINQELNQYYVLGYRPPDSDDMSCHALKVKVNRGGTVVRSRPGYCNAKPKEALAGSSVEKQLEAHAAAAGNAGGVVASMQSPFFYTSANVARVNVALEIPSNLLQFEKVKGKQHSEINVLGIAYRKDGSVGARFSDKVKLDLESKTEIKELQKKPLHYENQFDIASGEYNLKVVFSAGGESVGKVESRLLVEPYADQQFALSGVALSKEMHKAAELGAVLDAALIEDRVPLIYKGVQIVPAGSNRFKQSETALIYFEIYEPLLLAAVRPAEKPPRVAFQFVVIDRKTGRTKVDSGSIMVDLPEKNGSRVIPVGGRIPTKELAPGAYRLELMAADSGGKLTARTAEFEIQE